MAKPYDTPLYPYQRSPDQDRKAHHPVVVVGAGPVGLALAIDLAQQGTPVVILDDNDRVSSGSRAICFAKRSLEILDRLGCGDELAEKGVQWNLGKVYFRDRKVFEFNLLPDAGHKRPAFVNLPQWLVEERLVRRIRELQQAGAAIELHGKHRVEAVTPKDNRVDVTVETPEGIYELSADWLVACDGAGSPTRRMLGLDFVGRVFEDNFLIADIVMEESPDFPTERRFWFDPPFNRGQSALLHKQPDNIWRIDLQLGWNIDKKDESKPEKVIPRLKAFLGDDAKFELDWVSIYTFQCRRMERFRHGRVLFAGDSAHQVSPFGARGANSGFQDADNLAWKLAAVVSGAASPDLLDSYDTERGAAANENILHSTRSTEFITPKSDMSRLFRDAVLDLAEHVPATRPMVNSGRLSLPSIYDSSPLNGPDHPTLPPQARPGSPALDAPIGNEWLLDRLGGRFQVLAINHKAPEALEDVEIITLRCDRNSALQSRWLGDADGAIYLLRPDQHIAARWVEFDADAVRQAIKSAMGVKA